MDLKKVLDQTVREFKREVNKKVLKVPEIEQKVLDATSNEPWGPHGSHMADIAHATRNYHDYQMIMMILWKRINDTGRNWRHVYKSLTILEYLVAHGSERVIDELKEHAYQISTLSEFQYIDSSGRDQGLNVRRKSQALVALVNDKERIREVRQKAVSSRDKYRGVSSTGGMYRPSSYHSTDGSYGGDRYDDDSYSSNYRYGGRDDDRYRDKDADRYRDEERYGRDWDRSGRDGDRYRDDYYDNEENRYSSRRGDDRQGEKSGSYERDRDRSFDDDDRQSSRSGGRGDDYEHDDRRGERRPVGARMPAPPSYEEALGNSESAFASGENQRDGGGLAAAVARASKANNLGQNINAESANAVRAPAECADSIDEFDPRSAAAPSGGSQGDDFFGQAESFSAVLALPAPPSIETAMSNASDIFGDSSMSGFAQAIAAPTNTEPLQKTNGNVFGDSPFKADAPSSSAPAVLQPPSFTTNMEVIGAIPSPTVSNAYMAAPVPFDANEFFGDGSFNVATLSNGSSLNGLPGSLQNVPLTNQQQMPAVQQAGTWTTQPPVSHDSLVNLGQPVAMPMGQGNPVHLAAMAPQLSVPSTAGLGQNVSKAHTAKSQQKDKFETKSTVWADTLSKGLIDLNIGGPKTNPLAGIGIDFDLLRTERIKEERASAAKVSTTSMGKAMGSGSGLGMAGAGAIVPPSPPVMMNSMGMAPMMGAGMGVIPMGGNPGIAMRPGMGFAPAPSMGMVMNPMMGMGMGIRGYQNSQQQYSGYR